MKGYATEPRRDYTPALGLRALTSLYDAAIAVFTREGTWRRALLAQVAPHAGERIVDIGCGTGTFTRALKGSAPGAEIIGVDPDPQVLDKARARAAAEGLAIDYVEGFFDDSFVEAYGRFTAVSSSLVLHQVSLAEKGEIIRTAFRALVDGGQLHIADYGVQHNALMRLLFRNTVQRIDGREDTEHNARGVLPELMRAAGFTPVEETASFATPSGEITLFRAVRPAAPDTANERKF